MGLFSGKSSPETHGISHGLRWAFPTDVHHPKCPTWLDAIGRSIHQREENG